MPHFDLLQIFKSDNSNARHQTTILCITWAQKYLCELVIVEFAMFGHTTRPQFPLYDIIIQKIFHC